MGVGDSGVRDEESPFLIDVLGLAVRVCDSDQGWAVAVQQVFGIYAGHFLASEVEVVLPEFAFAFVGRVERFAFFLLIEGPVRTVIQCGWHKDTGLQRINSWCLRSTNVRNCLHEPALMIDISLSVFH